MKKEIEPNYIILNKKRINPYTKKPRQIHLVLYTIENNMFKKHIQINKNLEYFVGIEYDDFFIESVSEYEKRK